MLELAYSNPNPPKPEKHEVNKLRYYPNRFSIWSPSSFRIWIVIQGGRAA